MNSFTLPPWATNYNKELDTLLVIRQSDHLYLDVIAIIKSPNVEADAALIAAAPDLLSASQTALAFLESIGGYADSHSATLLRDAITKALTF